MYKIKAEKFYEDFHKDKEIFDFSNYQRDSKYYNNEKNLVVSEMNDETIKDNHKSKKAINVQDDKLKYVDYKTVLFSRAYVRHEKKNRIISRGHNIWL